jgi:hypothetical protein
MSERLNYSCNRCGMTSGRKESVRRHIRNPRIHSGNARIIPYIEYVAGLQVGIYQPIHNLYRQRHRESDQSLLGSEASNTLEDKIYRRVQEKTLDKIADGIVNRQWTFNHTPRRNRKSSPAAAKISRPTYLKQDIFRILMTLNPHIIRFVYIRSNHVLAVAQK